MKKLLCLALFAGFATPAFAINAVLVDVTGHAKTEGLVADSPGSIVGEYFGHKSGAYIEFPDGEIFTFAPPGACSTTPTAINLKVQIVGNTVDSDGFVHGFLREADGTLKVLDHPGALGTKFSAINFSGTIAGTFGIKRLHGFTRDPDGTFHDFDVPGPTGGTQVVVSHAKDASTAERRSPWCRWTAWVAPAARC